VILAKRSSFAQRLLDLLRVQNLKPQALDSTNQVLTHTGRGHLKGREFTPNSVVLSKRIKIQSPFRGWLLEKISQVPVVKPYVIAATDQMVQRSQYVFMILQLE